MANDQNEEIPVTPDKTEDVLEVSENSGNKKTTGLRGFVKDPEYRSKVMHTMCLSLTFVSLGLVVGQYGPTFLDLQIITGTDLEKASAFFTGGSIGYLVGSVVAGAIYSKVNKNCLMFSGAFSLGIVSAFTAYCKPYGLMVFIRCAGGITAGFLDTGGNSEQMRVWGNEGQGLMQFLHFAFAFGGVISPLYTAPFLAQKVVHDEKADGNLTNVIKDCNVTSVLNSDNVANIVMDGNVTNITCISPMDVTGETNVHIAFLITGVFAVMSGLPFLVYFILDLVSKRKEMKKTEAKVTQRKLPFPVFLIILLTLCLFYVLYCCVEDTFASFLMTFLVREYAHVTKARGAYITAIYWASFATSRFLMIFLSTLLSAVRLLYLCCTLMLIAFTSFIISAMSGNIIAVSVFAAMAGLSMSGVFPAGFLWTESELLRVTGPISSCILISASMGTMVNPLILGYLMEELTNMWFCYLLVGETVMVVVVFIFLLNFNRFFVNKRYGSLASSTVTESTINVEEQESQQPLSAGPDGRAVENGSV